MSHLPPRVASLLVLLGAMSADAGELQLCAKRPERPAGSVVENREQGWRMHLPDLPQETFVKELRLPWGKARARSSQGMDTKRGIILVFEQYELKRPPRGDLPANRLGDVPAALLHSHGCAKRLMNKHSIRDEAGTAWPAVLFEGSCEGGDRFRWLAVLFHGRLFAFQVAASSIFSQEPLEDLLMDFVAGFCGVQSPQQ
jgi:hypothetical protein